MNKIEEQNFENQKVIMATLKDMCENDYWQEELERNYGKTCELLNPPESKEDCCDMNALGEKDGEKKE